MSRSSNVELEYVTFFKLNIFFFIIYYDLRRHNRKTFAYTGKGFMIFDINHQGVYKPLSLEKILQLLVKSPNFVYTFLGTSRGTLSILEHSWMNNFPRLRLGKLSSKSALTYTYRFLVSYITYVLFLFQPTYLRP